MKKKAILFGAACVFAAAAAAQTYKWTDQNGRVQYGDAPPPGAKATPLRPPPSAPAPAAKPGEAKAASKAPLTPAEKEADYRKRQQEAAKERDKLAQEEQAAAATRENCSNAQDVLRTLQSGQRVSRTDAKGERYYLDDAQIAQETTKAQRAVQQWCK
jgi:hypothetical protein